MPSKKANGRLYDGSIFNMPDGKHDEGASKREADEIEALEVKEFRDLGKKHIENMDMVHKLILLPTTICAFDAAEMNNLVWEIKARAQSQVISPSKSSKEQLKRYQEIKQKIFHSEVDPIKGELAEKAMKEGEERFIHLLENDFFGKPYKALLYSGVVWIWCNFEVVMKDLWESALNMAGEHFIKDISKGMSKHKNTGNNNLILGKQITLAYLASFNYDLSNKLGTALLSKFNLDSLAGIKEAYSCTFPKSVNIKRALEGNILSELEAKRNVIVHQAGRMDATYCAKTGRSRREIGKELEISSTTVENLIEAVKDIVKSILKSVSTIVLAEKS